MHRIRMYHIWLAIERFVRTWIFRRPVESYATYQKPTASAPRPLDEHWSTLIPDPFKSGNGVVVSEEPRELVPLAPLSCRFEYVFPPRPYWLYDAVFITALCQGKLTVTMSHPDANDCISKNTITLERLKVSSAMLLGLNRERAESPVRIVIESNSPFEVYELRATHMRPGFCREQAPDGTIMIHFYDPFYKSIPESSGDFRQEDPHHRKLYGPGKDVGY